MAITSKYEIDGQQAISTMQSIQSAFQGYNGTLGQVISQTSQYNKVGGNSRQILTQVSDAGVKTTSVLKQVAGGYELISVRTTAATNAQRKAAEVLKGQADLSDKLAKAVGSGATPVGPTPSTTIPSVAPAKIGLPIAAYSNLTQAQLKAAAAANGLNAAQTKALLAIGPNSARAKQGLDTLVSSTEAVRNKFDQLGKIAFATAVYRGISLIQQALTEGGKSALSYSHQIGLIQTISQDSGESFDSWNRAIRGVADELGRPVAEVAKDAYDALSNQVIKSTKDFDFLRTAITLEQNTGSAPGTGLDTLSSLINGLGVSSLQAEALADKLFVTIDKGKVRLEELQGTIGRTTGLQQQAGASFDETAAALAVLTQTGLKADEATTLLNNIFSEIIKPNEALSKTFKDLGYDSGAAAVQAEGLGNILKKVGDIAKTTSAGLATYFPDIRGLRGESILFSQIDNFKNSLKEIGESAGKNKIGKGILDENDAQKILKEGERIKNFFTVDLGIGIIHTLAKISDSVGGFSKVLSDLIPVAIGVAGAIGTIFVVGTVVKFGQALGQLAFGFQAVASAIGIADGFAVAFGKTLTQIQLTIGIFAAVATATFIAATLAANRLASAQAEALKARTDPIDTQRDKTNEDNKTNASRRVEEFNKATDKMSATYGRFIASARKLNDQFAASSKKAFDEASEALKNSFDIALTFIRKNVNELETAEEKSLDNIKKLSESATDVKKDAADRQRDYQVDAIKDAYDQQKKYAEASGGRVNPQNAINQFSQIAQAQIAQARKARDAFLSQGDLKGAEKEYDKINQALQQFKTNVESVDGKAIGVPQADAFYAQEQINKTLAIKKQIEAQNQKEYNQALQQRQVAEKLNDVYKEQAKFGDQVFDKKGNLTDQFAGDPQKALAELDALNKKRHDLQAQLVQPKNPIEAARLNQSLAQADQEAAAQRNALAQRLAAATTDSSLSASSQARQALAEQEKKTYESLTQTILNNNKKLTDGAAEIKKLVGEISQGLNNPGQTTFNFGSDAIGGLREAFRTSALGGDQLNQAQKLLADLKNLSSQTDIDVPKIKAKLAELSKVTDSVKDHKLLDPSDKTGATTISIEQAIGRISTSLSPLKEAKSDLSEATGQMQAFKQAVSSIDATQFNSIVGTIQSLNQVAGGLAADASGVDALAAAMNTAAAAARNEAAALRELNAAKASGGGAAAAPEGGGGASESLASGGSVGDQGGFLSDFYSGKFAKGSDVIPAMLARGEYVINAVATRKFYSQLVAMNSGITPIYRSEGGGTGDQHTSHNYSINVGGGGGSPKETAKVVVQAIRRAQRQGTVR